MYKTMIRPHLEYVDFIIESGNKSMVLKLDRLQHRALRRIEYCKNSVKKNEYRELEMEYNIECLSSRRKRNLIGYMYYQGMEEMNLVKTRCDRILRSSKKALMRYNFSNLTKLHKNDIKMLSECLTLVGKPGNW